MTYWFHLLNLKIRLQFLAANSFNMCVISYFIPGIVESTLLSNPRHPELGLLTIFQKVIIITVLSKKQ